MLSQNPKIAWKVIIKSWMSQDKYYIRETSRLVRVCLIVLDVCVWDGCEGFMF